MELNHTSISGASHRIHEAREHESPSSSFGARHEGAWTNEQIAAAVYAAYNNNDWPSIAEVRVHEVYARRQWWLHLLFTVVYYTLIRCCWLYNSVVTALHTVKARNSHSVRWGEARHDNNNTNFFWVGRAVINFGFSRLQPQQQQQHRQQNWSSDAAAAAAAACCTHTHTHMGLMWICQVAII